MSQSSSTATSPVTPTPVPGRHGQAPLTFSVFPMTAYCPNCQKSVQTYVTPVFGCMTWIVFVALLPLGICCLPFLGDCTKDKEHHCIYCNYFFGSYKRIGF